MWSPPKSLAWQKGFRLGSGLISRRVGLWLLVCNLPLPVSGTGILLVVIVGILWLVALSLLLSFPARLRLIGGLLLILRFGLSLTAAGWSGHSASATHSSLAGLVVACC